MTAAPLKQLKRNGGQDAVFLSAVTGLRPHGSGRAHWFHYRFRRLSAVTGLRPHGSKAADIVPRGAAVSPRSHDCGPIEADRCGACRAYSPASPRSHDCGPIEADSSCFPSSEYTCLSAVTGLRPHGSNRYGIRQAYQFYLSAVTGLRPHGSEATYEPVLGGGRLSAVTGLRPHGSSNASSAQRPSALPLRGHMTAAPLKQHFGQFH